MAKKGSFGHRNTELQGKETRPACPLCGGEHIETERTMHSFEYGVGASSVELHVEVPVHDCRSCDIQYLDQEGERLRHAAVCEHLGVLPPHKVRLIRESRRMTRNQFAQVTGIDEADLNRWENGLSVQLHADDQRLRSYANP